MQSLIRRIQSTISSDTLLLTAIFCLLCLAAMRPSVPIKHDIHTYFFVIDITQSMNAADMQDNGQTISRIDYTKKTLAKMMGKLPCETKVGIGMFSGVNVVALYRPIEVCNNFSAILDTIEHIDWRSAWTADSRIRESMVSTTQVLNNFNEATQVIFLTDGEEAPKLHAFNTRDLSTLQGADGWLLVGVGTEKGAAIPRYDHLNQLNGYWSIESMELAPGAAPIAAAGLLKRKSDTAESVQDRYISKLAEAHLKTIASEIGAKYTRLTSAQDLLHAIQQLKSIRSEWARFQMDWLLATLACLLFILIYLPKRYLTFWRARLKTNKSAMQVSHEIKHQFSNEIILHK
jgi:mxaL protein